MSTARGGLLAIQSKRAESLSLDPVRVYCRATYLDRGESVVEGAIEDLDEVEKLRAEILASSATAEKHQENLTKYYSILSAMELRFPMSKDPSHIQLLFSWYDAFKPNKKEKQSNINFEKCSVLFNLAALHSQSAIDQDRTTSPGLVAACKKFQEAAGVFSFIKENVSMRTDAPHPLDISPDSAKMLEQLMLAQAQECVYEKAMCEKKSEGVCARLGKQCVVFYSEVVSIIAGSALNNHMEKSWLNHLRSKVLYFSAESEMLMAEAEKKKDESNIGPRIARLRYADLKIKEGEKASKNANNFIMEASKNLSQTCNDKLTKAVRDNESIYLESVPPYEKVPPISEACMVKAVQPSNLNKMSGDVFVGLVPDSSAKVVSKYTELVDTLIKKEKGKLNASTDVARSKLKEFELPEILVALDPADSRNLTTILSESLREKIAEVNSYGGVKHCFELAKELQGLRNVGTQMLNSAEQELETESNEDQTERDRYKEKWVIPASATLTGSLKASITDFRAKIQTARDSDKSTLQQLEQPENPILLLENENLCAKTPYLSKPMVSVGACDPETAANELKQCLSELDSCSAQRTLLEDKLNETKFKDNILPQLMSSSDSEEKIFNDQLLKYKPLQDSVAENVKLQEGLVAKLIQKHQQFLSVYNIGEYKSECSAFAVQVQHAYEIYKQIQENFEKGIRFYTSLQDAINALKMQCGDFCLTRKMQRDDFIRQLAYANQQQQQYQQQQTYGAPPPQQQQQQQQTYAAPPTHQQQQSYAPPPPQQQQHYPPPPQQQAYQSMPPPQMQGYPPHQVPQQQQCPPVPMQGGPPGGYRVDQAAAQMNQMHVAHQYPPHQGYPPPPPPQG
ncbi:programmed cell death 6-interacting protein [Chloropicon primus]|uniref:Programmed cell death 6-interacting protein n=1 Tax=Chloropicon primus TaxID=1764295 RepID=A0A5B8MQT9_9CHLO|nr:programmed cell death 6-interacting protein [Chloropicon primus]|eukprot:QDZ22773.1 programmed cell death 6-interacting protein [Chloropicon primus]